MSNPDNVVNLKNRIKSLGETCNTEMPDFVKMAVVVGLIAGLSYLVDELKKLVDNAM